MPPDHDSPIRLYSGPPLMARAPADDAEFQLQVRAKALEVGADVAQLLVHAGRCALEVGVGRENSAREDEASRRRLEELDKATRDYVDRAAAQLRGAKERTEQIRILADMVSTTGSSLPPAVAEGVAMALANLTRAM